FPPPRGSFRWPGFGFSEMMHAAQKGHVPCWRGLSRNDGSSMSHYARNSLQEDWASQDTAGMRHRVQAAEQEAGWDFDRATRQERAEFDAAMRALLGVTGPRADRARERARTRWHDATAEASALLEATIECLLLHGEVSAELDDQWTALFDRNAAMIEAAE